MDRNTIGKRVTLPYVKTPWEDMSYVGKCKGYEVYLDKLDAELHIFQLIDPTTESKGGFKVAAEVQLTRSYMGKAYQCSYSQVDSKYQGQGLAYYAYKFIMRWGYVLEAGHSQSKGSRKLWWRLSKDRNVQMIAKEKYSREGWIMPERDNKNKELKSDFFDIYEGAKEVNVYAYMVQ